MDSKLFWGPRLWSLLHHLAQVSDRRDMLMLWNNLMRLTAAVMPCEQCRHHLTSYLSSHGFIRISKTHTVTGANVRIMAINELFKLHNIVNARLEKASFVKEDLTVYEKTRLETMTIINRNFDEIKAAWTPLVHDRISGSDFVRWKKHVGLMIALASSGPD